MVGTNFSLVLGLADRSDEGCSDLDGKKLGSKTSCMMAVDGAIEG